jgi:hypothetical protein
VLVFPKLVWKLNPQHSAVGVRGHGERLGQEDSALTQAFTPQYNTFVGAGPPLCRMGPTRCHPGGGVSPPPWSLKDRNFQSFPVLDRVAGLLSSSPKQTDSALRKTLLRVGSSSTGHPRPKNTLSKYQKCYFYLSNSTALIWSLGKEYDDV